MPTPPTNMQIPRLVRTRCFMVEIEVNMDDPKHATIEQLEDRLADGPRWMDGVLSTKAQYYNRRESVDPG